MSLINQLVVEFRKAYTKNTPQDVSWMNLRSGRRLTNWLKGQADRRISGVLYRDWCVDCAVCLPVGIYVSFQLFSCCNLDLAGSFRIWRLTKNASGCSKWLWWKKSRDCFQRICPLQFAVISVCMELYRVNSWIHTTNLNRYTSSMNKTKIFRCAT